MKTTDTLHQPRGEKKRKRMPIEFRMATNRVHKAYDPDAATQQVEAMKKRPLPFTIEYSYLDAKKSSLHVRFRRGLKLIGHYYPGRGTLYLGDNSQAIVPTVFKNLNEVVSYLSA
jgi:hypothetical protein